MSWLVELPQEIEQRKFWHINFPRLYCIFSLIAILSAKGKKRVFFDEYLGSGTLLVRPVDWLIRFSSEIVLNERGL